MKGQKQVKFYRGRYLQHVSFTRDLINDHRFPEALENMGKIDHYYTLATAKKKKRKLFNLLKFQTLLKRKNNSRMEAKEEHQFRQKEYLNSFGFRIWLKKNSHTGFHFTCNYF